jgi:PAS domain S-box-containing protein/putative nucleotidyltransferase with HDIG domain
MTDNEALYLLPHLVSLTLSTSIFVYVWSKRPAKGATAFALYMLGQALWMAGIIFELNSQTLRGKLFWESSQWAAATLLIVTLPVFAVQYAEFELKHPRRLFNLSLILPSIFLIFLIVEPSLHLIFVNPYLTTDAPLLDLKYSFSALVYGYAAYAYLIHLWGLYILIRRLASLHGLYQAQVTLIVIGFFIHLIGTFILLMDARVFSQNDITPFTFAVGDFTLLLGLFRFRIFDVLPVARDKVFEAMVEPVVIVDNKNLIVDINISMLDLLGMLSSDVVGKPARQVFQDFPIPIKQHLQTAYARAEASFEIGGRDVHYEMTVWPMRDAHKNIIGRIFISHDITALKELEHELRKLNVELEDRVHARTRELAEAYDTTLEGWARALELRDKETEGHTRRVTSLTLKIASAMGICGDELEQVRRGAILHDIGKMGIADKILLKPGKLTREERETMQNHPETAYKLLSPIPFLSKALDIPYCHHEKWNGTGYPRGLKGEEIPLAARIFAAVDVWDAIKSDRPYKKAWSQKKAVEYFVEQSGKHFDPHVVNVFLEMLEKGAI